MDISGLRMIYSIGILGFEKLSQTLLGTGVIISDPEDAPTTNGVTS